MSKDNDFQMFVIAGTLIQFALTVFIALYLIGCGGEQQEERYIVEYLEAVK